MQRIICAALLCLISMTAASETTTVYLIRHAEKDLTAKQNPALTELGKRRAEYWSEVLEHQPINAVYSTDTLRTRSTALPTAEKHGLEISSYQPGQLDQATMLEKHSGKHVLVVGHSNTVPFLANRLIEQQKYAELDESEYSNLYIVTLSEGDVSSVRLVVEVPTGN